MLLAEQTRINEAFHELLELRFQKGLISAADVLQQRQQLAAIKGEIPLVKARKAVLKHTLAVLIGKPPRAGFEVEQPYLPVLRPLPRTGLPADLLLRRPDVRSAQLRLEASDFRVAEAIANRFPKLSITISASDAEEEASSLFKNWFSNIVYNLSAPLFDANRLKSEVDRTRALSWERFHTFEKTSLTAIKEVEDALVLERYQREYLQSLGYQIQLAQETLRTTQQRFQNGDTDYLPVLTALQMLQSLERQELTAHRTLIGQRIELHRALGGSWELDRGHFEQTDSNPHQGG